MTDTFTSERIDLDWVTFSEEEKGEPCLRCGAEGVWRQLVEDPCPHCGVGCDPCRRAWDAWCKGNPGNGTIFCTDSACFRSCGKFFGWERIK